MFGPKLKVAAPIHGLFINTEPKETKETKAEIVSLRNVFHDSHKTGNGNGKVSSSFLLPQLVEESSRHVPGHLTSWYRNSQAST